MSSIDIVVIYLREMVDVNLPSDVEVERLLPILASKIEAREASPVGHWELHRLNPDAAHEIEYTYSVGDTMESAQTAPESRLVFEWVDEESHHSDSSLLVSPRDLLDGDHEQDQPIKIRKKEPPPTTAFTISGELLRFGAGTTEEIVDLYISAETLSSALSHVQQHNDREVGGYFFGHVAESQTDRSAVVHIIGHYPVISTDSSRVHFKFQIEDSIKASAYQESKFPGTEFVGWYHSHPGHGIFLSAIDTATHQRYFKPYHRIAMVADPLNGEVGFFVKDHGAIASLEGAWIFDSLNQARPQSQTGLEEDSAEQEKATGLVEMTPEVESTDDPEVSPDTATPNVFAEKEEAGFTGQPDGSLEPATPELKPAENEAASNLEPDDGPRTGDLAVSLTQEEEGSSVEPEASHVGTQSARSERASVFSRFRGMGRLWRRGSKTPAGPVGGGNAKPWPKRSSLPGMGPSLEWLEVTSGFIGASEAFLAEARESVSRDCAELVNNLIPVVDELRDLSKQLETMRHEIHDIDQRLSTATTKESFPGMEGHPPVNDDMMNPASPEGLSDLDTQLLALRQRVSKTIGDVDAGLRKVEAFLQLDGEEAGISG